MSQFPESFEVTASMSPDSAVTTRTNGVKELRVSPPESFGGPGGEQTPESLLVTAVASCYLLTFKAVARASQLAWRDISVAVTGTLDRVERQTLFTRFQIRVELDIVDAKDADKARRAAEKSEQNCFVTNSLKSEVHLELVIR